MPGGWTCGGTGPPLKRAKGREVPAESAPRAAGTALGLRVEDTTRHVFLRRPGVWGPEHPREGFQGAPETRGTRPVPPPGSYRTGGLDSAVIPEEDG